MGTKMYVSHSYAAPPPAVVIHQPAPAMVYQQPLANPAPVVHVEERSRGSLVLWIVLGFLLVGGAIFLIVFLPRRRRRHRNRWLLDEENVSRLDLVSSQNSEKGLVLE